MTEFNLNDIITVILWTACCSIVGRAGIWIIKLFKKELPKFDLDILRCVTNAKIDETQYGVLHVKWESSDNREHSLVLAEGNMNVLLDHLPIKRLLCDKGFKQLKVLIDSKIKEYIRSKM